jgi:hypothetical protein
MRNRTQVARTALAAALALALAGCGANPTAPRFEPMTAVYAHLRVGETMADSNAILVTRTRPVDQPYDASEAAVSGALVLLQADGAPAPDTLRMMTAGRYANPAVVIAPRTTYHLTVRTGTETLTATTTTPAAITFLREPRELPGTMPHAAIANSFPIVVTGPDPEQILYLDLYCLESYQDARYVHALGSSDTPQDDNEYGGENGEPRHISAYFHMNDIDPVPGGYLVSFYGDMMWFYGRYRVTLCAIDDNEYQYLYRDHPELHGGIVGGIGVFGSTSGRRWLVNDVP